MNNTNILREKLTFEELVVFIDVKLFQIDIFLKDLGGAEKGRYVHVSVSAVCCLTIQICTRYVPGV